jgi:hypothetical protein
MCYAAAIPVVTLLISAAATTYTVYDQNQAVKAENKAREIGAESAAQSGRNQFSDVNRRLQQEQEAALNRKVENAKRAAEARATARTSSGQAGVSGLSVDSLLADFYHQEASYRFATDTNLGYFQEQTRRDLEGIRAGTESRVNSLRPEPVPGYLGAGLRIGARSVQAFDEYKTNTDPNWKAN